MTHLSTDELQEAATIADRLRNLVPSRNASELQRMFDRLTEVHDDAHSALFELRMLNCLSDQHLREVVFEWPVSEGDEGTTSIDLYVPSLCLAVELQSREGFIVRTVQGPSPGLPTAQALRYLQTEFNASMSRGDVTKKQAIKLFEGISAKCAKKRFAALRKPVWLITDLSRTDFISQYGLPRTFSEYLRDLGGMFTGLIAGTTSIGEGNYLVQCPDVFFAFHHRWLGNSERGIVVFPRGSAESAAAIVLADALHLPLTLVS